MSLVSFLFLILHYIGHFCFVLFVIFRELNFRAFSFLHLLLWRYMFTLMLIRQVILLTISLQWVFVSLLEILLSLERVKNKILSPFLLEKLGTTIWHLPLPQQFSCIDDFLIWMSLFLNQLICIVIIRVSFKFPTTQSCVITTSTFRLILTSIALISNMTPFLCHLFLWLWDCWFGN